MPTKIEISLNAEKYRKQLDALIQETRRATAQMGDDFIARRNQGGLTKTMGKSNVSQYEWTSNTKRKKVQIEAEIQGMERLDDLHKSIAKLPVRKTVTIPVKTSAGGIKKTWSDLRRELNDLSGGFKKILSSFIETGGAIGIFISGLSAAKKIAQHFYDKWISGMKEAGEMSERNASSIAEAAEVNEQYRQSGESALRKLSELSNVEKMSNVQKAEAVSLIAKLNKQYGDLGISIDRTTGKITGLDRAVVTRLQKDRDRRIREMEGQLKELQSARNEQDKIISSESFGSRLIGRGNQTKEAQQKREELDKQIRELMIRLNEARKSTPAEDYLNQQSAAVDDMEAQTGAREKDLTKRQWQDKVNAVDGREEKIDLIESRKTWMQEDLKRYQAEYKQADNDFKSATKDSPEWIEAARKMAVAHAKVQKTKEEIYNLQQQINDLERQENKEVDRILDQSEFELKYSKLIAAGEWDKAAALKQEYELKQRYLKLSEEEKNNLSEIQKQQRELNLRTSLRDQTQNLAWSVVEKAGQGKEASEQRALRDAEKTKGGKLTDSEIEATKKLHNLTWEVQNMHDPQFGDLSIQSNDLTSRGGFSGGAVTPDSEKIALETCNYNKRQAETAEKIMRFLEELGRN